MSCHLLPAKSTDQEICVDPPAEDRNGDERNLAAAADEFSSVFQFSPEVLKALGETLRSKVQLVDNESELKVLREAKEAAPANNSCQQCVGSGSLKSPVSLCNSLLQVTTQLSVTYMHVGWLVLSWKVDNLTRGQWPYKRAANEPRRSNLTSDLKSVTSITYISM